MVHGYDEKRYPTNGVTALGGGQESGIREQFASFTRDFGALGLRVNSLNIHPQLPFPLDDNRSKEKNFRPHCLQGIIPQLGEVRSSYGLQEITPDKA